MPRFHFVVQDGSPTLPYQEEVELSSFEEARDEAMRRFGPSSSHWLEQNRGWTVDVTDASGGVLFSLHVFAAGSASLWPYHLSQYG